MAEGLPSLGLLLDLIQREREHQLAHFDALDTKAGLVLGFAGLLATLAPSIAGGPFLLVGLVAVAAAVGFGLQAFWPRRLPTLEPTALRRYLTAEEQFTRLTVLDTLELAVNEGSDVLHQKGQSLKVAMIGLGVAGLAFGAGILQARL